MKKIWKIEQEAPNSFFSENSDYSNFILQILWNRGIKKNEEIKDFFSSVDNELYSSDNFSQIDEAIEIVIKHIKDQNKIYIYGDYDADGVTSSAMLFDILKILKASVDIYIPERKKEGYGINKKAIDEIKKDGGDLIITVDCGIRNKEEVDYAKSLGINVLVTDHHIPSENPEEVPDCVILNPKLENEKYPEKMLAGVGVAFKLVEALIKRSKLDDNTKEKLINLVLDLVAIGTVADCVPLIGENRKLLRRGLKQLNQTKRVGLLELFKMASIDTKKELVSWNIGFQIAPRINAAGRLGHASTSFELLVTRNENEAKNLARSLNNKNIERQQVTEEIFDEIEKSINLDDQMLVGITPEKMSEEAWEEGVVGLVAGRITEKYKRPTLVITKNDDIYKGSGRSINQFNLIEAVEECSEHLIKYGGHRAACGFSILPEKLDKFIECIKKKAEKKLKNADLRPIINIDSIVNLSDIKEALVNEKNELAPFGEGNPEPIFLSKKAIVINIMTMGADEQHIKFKLKSETSSMISAIGFNQTKYWKDIQIGDIINIVYTIEMNEFNGRKDVQMKIVDIEK